MLSRRALVRGSVALLLTAGFLTLRVLLKTRLQRSAELCAEKLVQQMMGSTISAAVKP